MANAISSINPPYMLPIYNRYEDCLLNTTITSKKSNYNTANAGKDNFFFLLKVSWNVP